jgi:hypothetical protein
MANSSTIIYVLTHGEYSDYKIIGVFSTKEKALAFGKAYYGDGFHKRDVEKYELDVPDINDLGKEVRINRDGTIRDICIKHKKESQPDRFAPSFEWRRKPFADRDSLEVSDQRAYLITWVHTQEDEHVVKIANERRTMLIANNLWGKDSP